MRLLGLDFETSGLDTAKDRIVEFGVVLWDTDLKKPLLTAGSFILSEVRISQEASSINGITEEMLIEFAIESSAMLELLNGICAIHRVEYLVAHNGENFDKPMLYAEINRMGRDYAKLRSLPWIDTRTDIPFPTEPSSRKLVHLAADHGFINPFPHRALFDTLTMLKILAMYDINEVIAYQKIPFVTLQACVSYDQRQLAKDARFSWEAIGDKKYPKMWVKKVKQNLLELEKSKCKFEVREIA